MDHFTLYTHSKIRTRKTSSKSIRHHRLVFFRGDHVLNLFETTATGFFQVLANRSLRVKFCETDHRVGGGKQSDQPSKRETELFCLAVEQFSLLSGKFLKLFKKFPAGIETTRVLKGFGRYFITSLVSSRITMW